jgi:hypothetical protein
LTLALILDVAKALFENRPVDKRMVINAIVIFFMIKVLVCGF